MVRARRARTSVDDRVRSHIRDLVALSAGDPLAPFAMRPEKQYVLSPNGDAAVGYRVRLRTAVASGDPVGVPEEWASAIDAFVQMAASRRLRVAVLGAGERALPMWRRHGLSAVPIGRDVVMQSKALELRGRRYRNLRQAVQRSHNAGVTVEHAREGELTAATVRELRALMTASRRDDERGFSMILGHMFNGLEPDAVVALARDADGVLIGAQRYLWAGKQDLSLDLPIRARNAPNGVDERLCADTVAWGRENGVDRVSLAFAPWPDLFEDASRYGISGRLLYTVTHVLDPLIRVERLYVYLRKFHAFDQERYVLLRKRNSLVVIAAFLLLEFSKR